MDAFKQLILRDWSFNKVKPRIYWFSIPHGCIHVVLCFTFTDGDIGVISEGIFKKDPPIMSANDASKIRHFVGVCKEETEDTLRSMLSSSVYEKSSPEFLKQFSILWIHKK